MPTLLIALLAVAVLMCGADAAGAQTTRYDDFRGQTSLDPARWYGVQSTLGSSGVGGLDLVREVAGGRLSLSHRVVGRTDSDTGREVSRNQVILAANPELVTALAFTVNVTRVTLVGCPVPGSLQAFVRAAAVGTFFNDGSSTGVADRTGDIGAIVWLERSSASADPDRVLETRGFLFRCTNTDCSTTTTLPGAVALGSARIGKATRLRMTWEPDNDRFSFQKNDELVQFVSYAGMSDTTPPVSPAKSLQVRGDVGNCTAEPRPVGAITAHFDDVFVNP
jgi:hypothetical protein